MVPQAAADHYLRQQRLTVATVAAVRRVWNRMGDDFDRSWGTVGPQAVLLTTAAQFRAAREAVAYVPAVLAETGQPDDPEGETTVRAIVGTASDGRPLPSLLYGAVTTAKAAVANNDPDSALERGGRWLDMAVQTQIADAARNAISVAITARPTITGYVRMLNPPSCSRCAILAGKWFRWNTGFARHPRCDCRHIPSSESLADGLTTDPRRYFDSLTETQQNRIFTSGGAQAIRDGADIGQVVNARRGMSTTVIGGRTVRITTEGVTRRGSAGRRLIEARGSQRVRAETVTRRTVHGNQERVVHRERARGVRLMPEQIYEVAQDRADAIRLLRINGFLD